MKNTGYNALFNDSYFYDFISYQLDHCLKYDELYSLSDFDNAEEYVEILIYNDEEIERRYTKREKLRIKRLARMTIKEVKLKLSDSE